MTLRSLPLVFLILCFLPSAQAVTPVRHYEQGTVMRMHMGDCLVAEHGFMAAMSGAAVQQTGGVCPEYTLATDKAVYIIVGKASNDLIPLARVISFRFDRNELAVRLDDDRRETRFRIKEMVLRSEWELQRAAEQKRADWVRQHMDAAVLLGASQ